MILSIPELSLVVLVGVSGSGKSTFARRYFKPTEVISSDFCRGLVSDDENDQAASKEAFELLHFIVSKRLAAGRLTVVDATNVQKEASKPLLQLAKEHDVLPAAIVLHLPEQLCQERNRARPDRDFGPHVIRNQNSQLRRSLRELQRRGSATSTSSAPRRKWKRRRSSGSRSGTIAAGTTGRSISSAMCTAASTNYTRSWSSSDIRSVRRRTRPVRHASG
jgi:predicted kinase